MGRQFEDVHSRRGAPMGRKQYGTPARCEGKIRLFRVRLDNGGYDDGGAYWGIGKPLYCAESLDGRYREFVRAEDREAAALALSITPRQLLRRLSEPQRA